MNDYRKARLMRPRYSVQKGSTHRDLDRALTQAKAIARLEGQVIEVSVMCGDEGAFIVSHKGQVWRVGKWGIVLVET